MVSTRSSNLPESLDDASTSAAQQAVEDRRPRLVATCAALPLARGDVPRARPSLPDSSCLSGCGRCLTAVRWADDEGMTHFQDLDCRTLVVNVEAVRAVGWLSSDHPYPRGPVPAEFLPALRTLRARWHAILDLLSWWPACMGVHQCEFCRDCLDNGDIAVPSGTLLFVSPTMLVHYVEVHGYLPPADFINAVLGCPDPSSPEYSAAIVAIVDRRNGDAWCVTNRHRESEQV